MKLVLRMGVLLILAAHFSVVNCSADETPEIAVLKGTGVQVNWLAFSVDGSRLAAAMSGHKIDKNRKNIPVPGEIVVWDVDKQQNVSVCKSPKADFTCVWISADGSTLVSVDQGRAHADDEQNNSDTYPIMVSGKRGYQMWDAATGKAKGSLIVPQKAGEFTAAAVSPNGQYLAVLWNERAMSSPGLTKPYTVGEISVWDLQKHKVQWTLRGSSHTGNVSWREALAFSPDGMQLAVYRSFGGPSSAADQAAPDRPDQAWKPLKLLTLEASKSEPTVTVLQKEGIPLPARLEWLSDGRSIILRDGGTFEVIDPSTGRKRDYFKIAVPMPSGSAPSGEVARQPGRPAEQPPIKLPNGVKLPLMPPPNRFPQPDSAPDQLPDNVVAPRSVLSADGSRLAIHFVYYRDKKLIIEHRVGIWDVGTRRLVGTLRLPDQDYRPSSESALHSFGIDQGWREKVRDHLTALAMSGDGKRLAVSDQIGTVRVYDTALISGTEEAPSGTVTKLPVADLAQLRADLEQSLQLARKKLLDSFDVAIDQQKRSKAEGAVNVASILREEKSRYEKHGLVPWSVAMSNPLSTYLREMADTRARIRAAIPASDTPSELLDLIDKQIIARWKQDPGGKLLIFYASGKLDDPIGGDTWTFGAGRITLRRKNKEAPGGFWIEKCRIESNGRKYSGTNQKNEEVSGTYMDEEK